MKNAKMAASSGRAEQLNAMITQVHVGRLTILDGSMLFVHADRDKLYRMVGEYMRSRPVIFPAARNIDWTTVPSDAYLIQVMETTDRDAVALSFQEFPWEPAVPCVMVTVSGGVAEVAAVAGKVDVVLADADDVEAAADRTAAVKSALSAERHAGDRGDLERATSRFASPYLAPGQDLAEPAA